MTKTATLLATLVMLIGSLLGPGRAAAHADSPPGASDRTSAIPADDRLHRAGEPLKRWKCGKWRGHGGIGWRKCARLTHIDDKVKIDYRERFHNTDPDDKMPVSCHHDQTTTWNFHVSSTVEAEAGVIFAKAKASISAGVAYERSSTKRSGIGFKVDPGKWGYCLRGIHGFTFRGQVAKQTCDSNGCVWGGYTAFSGSAPEAGYWEGGPGRGPWK